jgi:hypothetical protein
MAVISFPHGEPWVVSVPAFRMVLPVIAALPEGADLHEVKVAYHIKGLTFELMTKDSALRIAAALDRETSALRRGLLADPAADEWDQGLAEYLETLGLLLDDFLRRRLGGILWGRKEPVRSTRRSSSGRRVR